MAGFNDHDAGNKLDASIEDDHFLARAFDYTEKVDSPVMESQFENLDADTDEFDMLDFVGNQRAQMVDDSDVEIVFDSDDEVISEQKEGKIRGSIWRHVSVQSFEVHSSAGSNLPDKITDKVLIGLSNIENVTENGQNQYSRQCIEDKLALGRYNESQEPGESSEANALSFVDRYLSASVANLSPEVVIPKFNGLKSPLASCAKGSQNLAIKANLMTKIGISTFEWDEDQPDHGGEFYLKNRNELNVQRDELDVGVDTQMAAEAMEALLYAPPPSIDANEHEVPKKTPDSILKGATQKKTSKQFSFPSRANRDLQNDGRSVKRKRAREKSWKVVGQKKQKENSNKENVYNKLGLLKPDEHDSLGRIQEKVKTFSPVACRTRHGSLVKRSNRSKDIPCNLMDIDILNKRKMGDLDANFLPAKRTNSLISGSGQVLHKLPTHLKFDVLKWPKQRRTRRNMRQNEKFITNFYALSLVVGNFVRPCESEGNFKEAFLTSIVTRRARSASRYRPTSGNKHVKGLSKQKFGSVLSGIKMIPESSDGSKASSGSRKLGDVDAIPIKKNSTRSSPRTELTRLGCAESVPDFVSKDLRRRRNKVEIRVLFSQSLDDDIIKQQKKIMARLGTSEASDCLEATHFVADRFARTKKMLEAMAFGKPVVTHLWLESCGQAKCIIDEKKFILRDDKKEKEIGFSMPVSISHAKAHPLLKGRRVFITQNVEPDKEMIVSLVKAVHGQVIMECDNISDNLLILSCEQDYEVCVPFLDKGAAIYSSELILNGIIIQKLEYARHELFNNHVKLKRYTRRRKKDGCFHLDVSS